MGEQSKQYKECAWCKQRLNRYSEIMNISVKSRVDIEYESSQYIDKIIFPNIEDKSSSFLLVEDDENEPFQKEIPVFVIPYRDDEKDISVNTCGYECAEAVKAALYTEDYVYQWTFS